jgi:hypothetical protein
MNQLEYNALLQTALDKWGLDTQVLIWIEEMSELIKALAKRNRYINPSYDSQIEDEIADVDICNDQMKMIFFSSNPSITQYYNPNREVLVMRWINRLAKTIETFSDRSIGELQLLFDLSELNVCLREMKLKYPGYEEYRIRKIERLKRLVETG